MGNVSYLDQLIILRAQAVIRTTIGEYKINYLVENRKEISRRIKETLEETTGSWGLEVRKSIVGTYMFSEGKE